MLATPFQKSAFEFSGTEQFFRKPTDSWRPYNGPISAAVAGTGNSSVFRHTVSSTGLPYVLAESGFRLRGRKKRPEIGGKIRTFSAM
jgi:hypothetical protein